MTAHLPPTGSAYRRGSERGAILVQVAIALIVLIGFGAFVIDYGVMWVGRRQAQNSADAGALAGAVALAFDDFADRSSTGPAKQSAHNFALANEVIGESPNVLIDTDVLFYDEDPSKFPDECVDDTCIRVDVYRNQARNNPLPIWFGQILGLTDQGVRATAIARASYGNASDCLKPWAVVDRWDENWENGAPNPLTWEETTDPNFDKYLKSGDPDPNITTPDHYEPASVTYDDEGNADMSTYDPGTGFHPFEFTDGAVSGYAPDYGRLISLKLGDAGDWNFGAGWFMRLNLAPFDTDEDGTSCTANGAKCYREHIKGCVGVTWAIGDELMIDNSPGSATGPTRDAVGGPGIHTQDPDSLFMQDQDASWYDPDGSGPEPGSVINCSSPCPRIVAIPLVNPDALMQAFKNGNNTVPISNIAGFFVEGVEGNGASQVVTGRLVTIPGLKTEGNGGEAPSTFMINISLIR